MHNIGYLVFYFRVNRYLKVVPYNYQEGIPEQIAVRTVVVQVADLLLQST